MRLISILHGSSSQQISSATSYNVIIILFTYEHVTPIVGKALHSFAEVIYAGNLYSNETSAVHIMKGLEVELIDLLLPHGNAKLSYTQDDVFLPWHSRWTDCL